MIFRSLLLIVLIQLTVISPFFAQVESPKKQAEQYIRKGQYQKAIEILESVPAGVRADSINREQNEWLENLYLLEKQWKKIIALHQQPGVTREDSTVLTMARLFSRFPAERITCTGPPAPIPFKPSITKTPMISVWVQGRKYTFWVDTGAGLTVISSKVAEKCNVSMSANRDASTTAATGKKLSIGYGVIDSLRFGPVRVFNHNCLVMDHKQLEVKVAGITITKIDGIIGWNLLQELAVTIHRHPNTILFAPSEGPATGNPNFIWMSYPLVTCTDSTGKPLLFGIDTGASSSSLHVPILSKTDTTLAVHKNKFLGSAGGNIKITLLTFPRVVIFSQGEKIVFSNIFVTPDNLTGIFAPDGVFGWKELIRYTVSFDFRKGVFRLEK